MALFPVPGPGHRVDVSLGVDESKLVEGCVAGRRLNHLLAVHDAVRLDELASKDHPCGAQGVLGTMVVPGRVVPVPDQLDAVAHVPIIEHAPWTGSPPRRPELRPAE